MVRWREQPKQQTILPVSKIEPPNKITHERILEGDGSQESPFVFEISNWVDSAVIQGTIVDLILGPGTYKAGGTRHYTESPRGRLGNGDICEHVYQIDGKKVSLWFDLYLVTRLVEEPGQRHIKKKSLVASPTGKLLQEAIQGRASLAEPKSEKKTAGNGCLIIIIIIVVLYLISKM